MKAWVLAVLVLSGLVATNASAGVGWSAAQVQGFGYFAHGNRGPLGGPFFPAFRGGPAYGPAYSRYPIYRGGPAYYPRPYYRPYAPARPFFAPPFLRR